MTDGNEPASPFTWWDHSLEGPAPRETYSGLTKREAFAMHAPQPSDAWMQLQRDLDRGRNPHNEDHKPPVRDDMRLRTDYQAQYADALIAALNGGEG